MLRILVIEDDGGIRSLVLKALRQAGYQAVGEENGALGLAAHQALPADLIVLDLMLPGMDGFEVIRTLRPKDEVPVIMLTAMGQEQNRIQGFEAGADDYLVKPFSIGELLARIRAILKRSHRQKDPLVLQAGPFLIDAIQRTAHRQGVNLGLTPSEFNLLEALVNHPGQSLTIEDLLGLAWPRIARPTPPTVPVHISHLRRKLAQEGDRAWILSAGTKGYAWSTLVKVLKDGDQPVDDE
jgi:DNA-binding response OmpR family regulator